MSGHVCNEELRCELLGRNFLAYMCACVSALLFTEHPDNSNVFFALPKLSVASEFQRDTCEHARSTSGVAKRAVLDVLCDRCLGKCSPCFAGGHDLPLAFLQEEVFCCRCYRWL